MPLIRPMAAQDIVVVAEIENENLSPWSAMALAAELQIRHSLQLVAEDDSGVVGWCCCRVIRPEAELCKIAVKKTARRQGVASSLLEFLIRRLRDKRITTLFLEVRSANGGGISFYNKSGFFQVGIRPGYYNKPPDSASIFRKDIMEYQGGSLWKKEAK